MIDKVFLYLVLFIPFSFLLGPFITDCTTIFITIFFLIKINQKKNLSYFKNNFFKYFFLFNIILIVSSLFSENILHSLKSSFFFFRFYICSIAIWYALENYKNLFKKFIFFSIIAIFFTTLGTLYEFIFIKNFFHLVNNSSGELTRLSGFLTKKFVVGSYLTRVGSLLFAISIIYFLSKKNNLYILFSGLLYVVIIIFLSGERTAFFSIFLFSFLSLVYFRKKINIYLGIFVLLLSLSISLNFEPVKKRMIDLTISQLNNTMFYEYKFKKNDSNDFVYLSVHHNAHARTALKMFYDSPIIGHGPGMFRFVCHKFTYNEFSCTTHPHNFYLQLLAETGTFGFLFLLIFFIQLSIKIFTALVKPIYNNIKNIELLLYLSILISIIPFFPSGNLFNNWLAPQIFLPFGFLLYLHNRKNL
jgi:O-antigen ligase